MHVDEEEGLPAQDPLPGDRPRRQPRRLGRAAAADRPHPPAARAHGGDRPSDRRRRQIWRAGSVPDRRRSAASSTSTRGGSGSTRPTAATIDVTAELPPHFAESLATLGLRADGRRHAAARPARPGQSAGSQAAAGGGGGQGARGASARASGARAAGAARARPSGGEPAGDLRLRRDAGRQRRDDLPRARRDASTQHGIAVPPPRGCRRVIGLSLVEAMAALVPGREPRRARRSWPRTTSGTSSALRADGRGRGAACSTASLELLDALEARRLAAGGRDRQVGPRPQALPRPATASTPASSRCRPPTAIRPSRTRRWSLQAIADAGAAPETTHRRSATPASTWAWRGRRRGGDRRRLGLSRRRGTARRRRDRGRRAAGATSSTSSAKRERGSMADEAHVAATASWSSWLARLVGLADLPRSASPSPTPTCCARAAGRRSARSSSIIGAIDAVFAPRLLKKQWDQRGPAERMKRFWKTAKRSREDGGWGVQLDGRPVRTPARALLAVPTEALAEAIADEWNAGRGRHRPARDAADRPRQCRDRPGRARPGGLRRGPGAICRERPRSAIAPRGRAALVERQAAELGSRCSAWARRRFDVDFATTAGHHPRRRSRERRSSGWRMRSRRSTRSGWPACRRW